MKNLIIKPVKDILISLEILQAKYNPSVAPGQANDKLPAPKLG